MLRDLPLEVAGGVCSMVGASTVRGLTPGEELDGGAGPVDWAFGFVDGSAGLWLIRDDPGWAILFCGLPEAARAAQEGLVELAVGSVGSVTQWEVPVVNTGDHLERLADRDLLEVGGGFAGTTAGSPIIATGYGSWVPVTFASVPSRGEWWISSR